MAKIWLRKLIAKLNNVSYKAKKRHYMRVGDTVIATEENLPGIKLRGKVKRFYPLIEGGEGVQIGFTSIPLSDISNVRILT